ncbi:MAG: hypothetical protein Q9181_004024, partial [Wetmoreana brouardii]
VLRPTEPPGPVVVTVRVTGTEVTVVDVDCLDPQATGTGGSDEGGTTHPPGPQAHDDGGCREHSRRDKGAALPGAEDGNIARQALRDIAQGRRGRSDGTLQDGRADDGGRGGGRELFAAVDLELDVCAVVELLGEGEPAAAVGVGLDT